MIWLVWRRLRIPLGVALGLALLLAAVAVAGRLVVVSTAYDLGFGSCVRGANTGICTSGPWYAFREAYGAHFALISTAALALPGVTGAVAGAGLFGGETSRGTHVFALTQSVSRLRWWGSGLLVAGLPVALATGLAVPATGWAYGIVEVPYPGTVLDPREFLMSGVAPAAYTVLAFCIAACAGLLLHSVVGALGIALVAAIVVPAVLTLGVRQDYLPPVTVQVELPPRGQEDDMAWYSEPGALRTGHGYVTASGELVRQEDAVQQLDDCSVTPTYTDCMRDAGFTGRYTAVQPSERYWPFQLIESGILLALSALALGAGLWGLRRRVH